MLKPATDLAGQLKSFVANVSQDSNAPSLITAAGTGDATKVTGYTIDTYNSGQRGESVAVVVSGLAALGAAETLSIAAEYQVSADGSTWDTAVALYAATVVATGDTGGSNESFVKETHLKIKGLKRYLRINITPDLSRGATDTALYSCTVEMAGVKFAPVS